MVPAAPGRPPQGRPAMPAGGEKSLENQKIAAVNCFDSPRGRHYHCAPMSAGYLPAYIEPFRLCDAGARLVGRVDAARLQRIRELSRDESSDFDVELEFGRDVEKRARISGTIDGTVRLTCERCLELLEFRVHCDVSLLAITAGSDIPELADDPDILEVADERTTLATLAEDEILLALPQYPVHDNCGMVDYDPGAEVVIERQDEKPNPFAALAKLKQKD